MKIEINNTEQFLIDTLICQLMTYKHTETGINDEGFKVLFNLRDKIAKNILDITVDKNDKKHHNDWLCKIRQNEIKI